MTAAGARLLAQRLAAPLTDPAEIAHRLDAVAVFVDDSAARNDLRAQLKAVPDLARALSRIVIDRGGPRDLAAIREGIFAAVEFAAKLSALGASARHAQAVEALRRPDGAIAAELKPALAQELPAFRREAALSAQVTSRRSMKRGRCATKCRRVIAALQVRYAESNGIRALKIRHNNVLGYFVDVSAQHGEKLMSAPPMPRSCIAKRRPARCASPPLSLANSKPRSPTPPSARCARTRTLRPPRRVRCRGKRDDQGSGGRDGAARRGKCAGGAGSRAQLHAPGNRRQSRFRDCRRPPSGGRTSARRERRPVRRQRLRSVAAAPIPPVPASGGGRDGGRRHLARHRPEHGRKIDLPPPERADHRARARWEATCRRSAHIGIVDRCSPASAPPTIWRAAIRPSWSRWSRPRDPQPGRRRALVILDEIGRGTATFDGLSIAWATVEHLHESNRCRTLFATHFHEMTALRRSLTRLHNATMRVREWQGDVVFLHEVVAGAADRSYGIQVAKLAGLPRQRDRARQNRAGANRSRRIGHSRRGG